MASEMLFLFSQRASWSSAFTSSERVLRAAAMNSTRSKTPKLTEISFKNLSILNFGPESVIAVWFERNSITVWRLFADGISSGLLNESHLLDRKRTFTYRQREIVGGFMAMVLQPSTSGGAGNFSFEWHPGAAMSRKLCTLLFFFFLNQSNCGSLYLLHIFMCHYIFTIVYINKPISTCSNLPRVRVTVL